MVKVGFLVEGDTEKVIIQSEAFEQFCKNIGIEIIRSVFPPHKKERGKDVFKNAEKIKSYLDILKDMGADYVCCLRDLEDLPCMFITQFNIVNCHDNSRKNRETHTNTQSHFTEFQVTFDTHVSSIKPLRWT